MLVISHRVKLWDLLGNFEPGPLEAEDGAAVERGRDLQHGVVVVEAATDVRHRHPLLHHRHPRVHVVPVEDLRGDPVTDLTRKRKLFKLILWSVHLSRQETPTSLKCLVVFMMYGVRSFLSFFIQPWPKNSLQKNKNISVIKISGTWWWTHRRSRLSSLDLRDSLVRDDFEDQVVQHRELLSYLQSWVVLKWFGLTLFHCLNTKIH